jgi:hypothetical protein
MCGIVIVLCYLKARDNEVRASQLGVAYTPSTKRGVTLTASQWTWLRGPRPRRPHPSSRATVPRARSSIKLAILSGCGRMPLRRVACAMSRAAKRLA